MWNSLKSDIYRTLHTKSFYVILSFIIVLYALILTDSGVQTSTIFAQFHREQNTFADFLIYFPKSGLFVLLVLLFVAIFMSDEYIFDYAKNTYSIHVKKWKMVLSRYLYCFLITTFYTLAMLLCALVIQVILPMKGGSIQIGDYAIYLIIQIAFIGVMASFIMMVIHLTRSRIIAIVIPLLYGMQMWYMLVGSIIIYLLKSEDILKYTTYQSSGELPSTFSIEGYSLALFVLIGNTLLYNGISYLILKKKDI